MASRSGKCQSKQLAICLVKKSKQGAITTRFSYKKKTAATELQILYIIPSPVTCQFSSSCVFSTIYNTGKTETDEVLTLTKVSLSNVSDHPKHLLRRISSHVYLKDESPPLQNANSRATSLIKPFYLLCLISSCYSATSSL